MRALTITNEMRGRGFNYAPYWLDVRAFGAKGDGVADNTVPIQAAMNAAYNKGGGIVYFPQGIYVTDAIALPIYPYRVILIGAGREACKLQPLKADTPIIQGASAVVPDHGTASDLISGFTFKAHASGSTGPAIDCRIISFSRFEQLGFEINGTGQWKYGFFLDGTDHCYSNIFDDIVLRDTDAITDAVVRLENHANLQYFDHFRVGKVETLKTAFSFTDAGGPQRISGIWIQNSHFEGLGGINPCVIDIRDENKEIFVQNCYFEDVVKVFDENATSDCVIQNCLFASSPGDSQPTALNPKTNFQCFLNRTGGSNVANALFIYNGLHLYDSGHVGIKLYKDGSTTTRATIQFNNDRIEVNFPIKALELYADDALGVGTTNPKSKIDVVGLPVYANNAAALAGGLVAGSFYRTGGDPDSVCVVH